MVTLALHLAEKTLDLIIHIEPFVFLAAATLGFQILSAVSYSALWRVKRTGGRSMICCSYQA